MTRTNGADRSSGRGKPHGGNVRPATSVSGRAQVGPLQKRADRALLEYRAHLMATMAGARTRVVYGRKASAFLDWVVANKRRAALREEAAYQVAVSDYLAAMRVERAWSAATANLSLAALCHYGRWSGLGAPTGLREQIPRRAPKALEAHEEAAVVGAARDTGAREAAVVALMAFCGLRVSEVAALAVDDLVGDHVVVRSGKGRHWRTVPMPAAARSLVKAWLVQREPGEGPLFRGRTGPISTYRLGYLVREVGSRAGVTLSSHQLRHCFATRLIRSGVDVVAVAELMGHRSLETTRAYSAPTEEDVARMVEAAVVLPEDWAA